MPNETREKVNAIMDIVPKMARPTATSSTNGERRFADAAETGILDAIDAAIQKRDRALGQAGERRGDLTRALTGYLDLLAEAEQFERTAARARMAYAVLRGHDTPTTVALHTGAVPEEPDAVSET